MGCSSSKPNARAADPADVDVAVAEDDARATFYSDTIPRPDSFDPAIFAPSVASAHRGEAPSAAARDSYTMYWVDNPDPWRHACRDGMPPVEDADVIAREEAAKKEAESDDACGRPSHYADARDRDRARASGGSRERPRT